MGRNPPAGHALSPGPGLQGLHFPAVQDPRSPPQGQHPQGTEKGPVLLTAGGRGVSGSGTAPPPPMTWPLSLGAYGPARNPHCPTREASHGIPALRGSLKATCATRGQAPTLSGLGLGSGRGCTRSWPHPAWKAVCGGATQSDRRPALGPDCRVHGTYGESSPQWVCGAHPACCHVMGSWASLQPPQAVGPDSWTFPHGSSEDLQLLDWRGLGLRSWPLTLG